MFFFSDEKPSFVDDLEPYMKEVFDPSVVRTWLESVKLPPLSAQAQLELELMQRSSRSAQESWSWERKHKRREGHVEDFETVRREARRAEIEYVRQKLGLGSAGDGENAITFCTFEPEEQEAMIDRFETWDNWSGTVPQLIETPPTPPPGSTVTIPLVHVTGSDDKKEAQSIPATPIPVKPMVAIATLLEDQLVATVEVQPEVGPQIINTTPESCTGGSSGGGPSEMKGGKYDAQEFGQPPLQTKLEDTASRMDHVSIEDNAPDKMSFHSTGTHVDTQKKPESAKHRIITPLRERPVTDENSPQEPEALTTLHNNLDSVPGRLFQFILIGLNVDKCSAAEHKLLIPCQAVATWEVRTPLNSNWCWRWQSKPSPNKRNATPDKAVLMFTSMMPWCYASSGRRRSALST
ncbi:hypothetical protein FN846DRAFT_229172 [Sphaerosporella brunnea]|uniref:Uncharacterized protein n=1 Tax=Sphaerosporella brunnea TaxID=1250544 RepID=A0A5J5ENI4_9PEZI|nr:hypothetical protein FN846DRAFT_229172 [Sphaerosporella brunnea]